MADHSLMSFSCPECGGSMVFNPTKGKLQCEYCDSLFTREEVEKFFAEKEQKIGEKDESKGWGEEEESSMRGYNCSSCGAELITDANTAVMRCPYCGNQTVAPVQFSGALRPDYVVPFAFTKKQAIEKYKGYYSGKFLLPKDFIASNQVEEIQGVYVPFWLFNGTADAEGEYEAYDKHDEGNYEFDKLEKFTTAYLPGFMAEKFDVKLEDELDRAGSRVKESVKTKLHNTIKHTGFNTKHEKIDVNFNDTKYALLPVWLLTTNWNGKKWTFAMNGQTGKFIGDLPVSKLKLTLISVATFIASFIIFSMIWSVS